MIGFLFPFDQVKKNSKIIIYGAGDVGRQYLSQIKSLNYCHCLYIVDKNHRKFSSIDGVKVRAIESLESTDDFDYIVIASSRPNDEKYRSLSSMNIPDSKIIKSSGRKIGIENENGVGSVPYQKLLYKIASLESMIDSIYASTKIDKKHCCVCEKDSVSFLPYGGNIRKNAQCPNCKSLERHRALFPYLKRLSHMSKLHPIKLLHFAPEPMFHSYFSNHSNVDYYPVDFNPSFKGIRKVVDIQHIPYDDDTFDVILCSHVLEHVPDDAKAIKEMHRVLKPDGFAYINVPLSLSLKETREDPAHNTPELRRKHYGRYDHLRQYGNDYPERLAAGGFSVEKLSPNKNLTNRELLRYGLLKNELIFRCKIPK